MRKEEDIKATFEVAKKEFGGVDVVVNSAGLAHNSPLLTGKAEDWQDMFEVWAEQCWVRISGFNFVCRVPPLLPDLYIVLLILL